MNKTEITCFPSDYGESILLSIEKGEKNYNILIDCGFKDTYRKYIKFELLKKKKIDLLVLTHIDDDHIEGAVELFSDQDTLKSIQINEIWFNDLFKIALNRKFQFSKSGENINTSYTNMAVNETETGTIFDEEVGFKKAKTISNLLINSEKIFKWNTFDDGLIQTKNDSYRELNLNEDIKIVILAPHMHRLSELFLEWCNYRGLDSNKILIDEKMVEDFNKYFSKIGGRKEVEIFDEECSYEKFNLLKLAELSFNKNSTANNASIAFIVEISDKRMLFLGDSNSRDIQTSLNKYILDKKINKINFDLVKVSHHGSKNNITNDYFKIASSKKYLVSTNGRKFDHPDLECLSKIIVNQKEYKELYFNYYHQKVYDNLFDNSLKTNYHYEIHMPKEFDVEKVLTIEL
ncbi:MBL fold metallo-hydrolase [Clostridium estertheticum]|uniref:MBL fold metallo-hydrolase n=1 Tax=Clostridium estertheticum TaxID=238834 RepID=UPI001C0CC2DA|nr:MBL fold metallo-hydrolase [Clostridium estertheticum]MBU3075690.1 MBL fold metallo-hydrolase [Clostridium estertheticum]MBU3165802.1 MBL fold metallo-hydrolase [Clostridium estertheticum]